MLAKATKKLNDAQYQMLSESYDTGYFFIYDNETGTHSNIRSCREEIAQYFDEEQNWFGLSKTHVDIKQLNNFWKEIEAKLGIKKDFTWFYRTDLSNNCIVIRVSPFWMDSNLKRGMFTLLLRMGAVYYTETGDFDKDLNNAIKKYDLARYIKDVIKRFLDNHTNDTKDVVECGGQLVSAFQELQQSNKYKVEDYLN